MSLEVKTKIENPENEIDKKHAKQKKFERNNESKQKSLNTQRPSCGLFGGERSGYKKSFGPLKLSFSILTEKR